MIWIAVLGMAGIAAVVGGAAGTLAQFAPDSDPRPRVPLRARYRRGRHHHPRRALLAVLLDGWRDLAHAHAHALMTGGTQPW